MNTKKLSNNIKNGASKTLETIQNKASAATNAIKNIGAKVSNTIKSKMNNVQQKITNVGKKTENSGIPLSKWTSMTQEFLNSNL